LTDWTKRHAKQKLQKAHLVKGLAATGIIGGLGLWRNAGLAVNNPAQPNVLKL